MEVKEKNITFAANLRIKSYTNMEKVKVSQDTLYQFMLAHDVKMTRLAQLIGKSDDVVTSCFKHHKDVHGNPRRFNREHIKAINEALPQLAQELQARLLTFGSEQTFTNTHGRTYDPALIEAINNLGTYLNVTGMMTRLLGWTKGKKSAVFCQPSSKAYGNISEQDMITINNEVLAVAGVLSNYEVVADDSDDTI